MSRTVDGETFDPNFGAPETPKMSADDFLRELDSRKAQIDALCKELETYRKELAHYKRENDELLNCIRRLAAIIGGMTK